MTVPYGAQLLSIAGADWLPAGPVSSISVIGAPGRVLLRGAAGATGAPSAAIAALNEFVSVSLMKEWLGFHFLPRTSFPDPFSRKQTKFSQKQYYNILDEIASIFFLFNFLLTRAESLKASKAILSAYTVLLHLKLFALINQHRYIHKRDCYSWLSSITYCQGELAF